MVKKSQLIALACVGIVLGSQQLQAQQVRENIEKMDRQKIDTANDQIDMKKLSETFGNFLGRHLQTPGVKFDMESLIKGIRAGAAGEASPLSEKEYEEMMAKVQEKAFKEMSGTN